VIVAGEGPRRRRREETDEDLGAWSREAGGGPSAVGGGRPVGAGEREREGGERESASGGERKQKSSAAVRAVQCFLHYYYNSYKRRRLKKRWLI